jgi:hypothetical protein
VAASNVVHLDAAKHSVKSWLDKATIAGGEMPGGEALKAYKQTLCRSDGQGHEGL